ncbi:BhlA/UviB family holin-like peptide [Clostridium neuense]|uniref:BhlA/UviB family holin-like peptide n=1 Tax=Clostridium neuense TaxID=1728934 RepID=A0ABW8T9R5_9CLOT
MENEILKLAASQGVWALLSVILIFYMLKSQEKRDVKEEEREKNYYNLINKLINKFSVTDVDEKNFKQVKRNLHK